MSPITSHKFHGGRAALRLAIAFALAASAQAKGPKRCDWHGPLSSGENPFVKCVDFASLNGKELTVPGNVTRIAADGLSFCVPNSTVPGATDADVVFIYDNSGSMNTDGIYVGTGSDTSFYFLDRSAGSCINNVIAGGTATYQLREGGTRTVKTLNSETGCDASIAGDPYQARGYVIKQGIDFLTKSAPGSTAGAMGFKTKTEYEMPPKPVSDATAMTQLKASIKLDDDDGGTEYGPPLLQAKKWLNDTAIVKTKKQAIIFISDGAPNTYDYSGDLDASMPTIYSIYMAKDDASAQAVSRLKELADKTGGTYTRVNPKDPNGFLDVLKGIITSITTSPGAPKSATITNKTLKPPQTSHTLGAVGNPDGSIGMKLDSIIALAVGKNTIEIQLTKDDNTTATYSFTMNVAGDPASETQGNYSCYDMPTLTAIDKSTGQPPEIYSTEKTSYSMVLTRSPSDLGAVSVAGSTPNNDKESIDLGAPDLSTGVPTQSGAFKYDPNKGSATAGNGVLEVDNHGDLTFTWSHPRDAREAVTYVLPGRIVPILPGAPEVEWITDLTKKGGGDGVTLNNVPKNGVLITDLQGKCIQNCSGTEPYHKSVTIPSMKVTIRSPITYTARIYDNFAQFVNQQSGQIDSAAWNGLSKKGDSAVVVLKILPFSKDGQALGTGAYILKLNVEALGDQVTKSVSGESIIVKNAHRQYVSRFGYLRAH